MNLNRTLTLVALCGVLAALLSSAATSGGRRPMPVTERKPAAVDLTGEALAAEIARLHDRLHPTASPIQPGRNLFEFGAAPVAPRAVSPTLFAADPQAAPPREPPYPLLKMIGVAQDDGADGPVRTAIIAGTNDLFFVKEGDTVAARFRVVRVDEDAVSLEDVNDGSSLRLSMK